MGLRDHELARIFLVPALLALLSLIGLVVALLDDGLADVLGWVLISLPLFAILRAWRRRS